jgi:hypothetical protein
VLLHAAINGFFGARGVATALPPRSTTTTTTMNAAFIVVITKEI